jgi:SAM-dependent methyltransferase
MDQSFDLVIAMAVFQQVRFPMVAMQEVQRVLKPGGVFLGTVSFLEPFHGNGFYHYTILGIENLLTVAGLKINYLAPVQHWSALEAQAHMGLFPKMPAFLAGLMVLPTLWLHKLWWKIGARFNLKATEKMRAITLAGSFQFAAEKP